MKRNLAEDKGQTAIRWIDTPFARSLLREKHALAILALLYEDGGASTRKTIVRMKGHASTVIATLRTLESLGLLQRIRDPQDHYALRASLTAKGMQVVETPIHQWPRLLLEWNRLPIQNQP